MIIYCDGGSRGNPGNSASSFVVTSNEKVIYKESKFLGVNTNNYAEYTAVIMATEWIVKNKVKDCVTVNLDSQLVERQLNGIYKVKSDTLINLFNYVKKTINDNKLLIKFVWGYREKNKLADSLVNEELDKHESR